MGEEALVVCFFLLAEFSMVWQLLIFNSIKLANDVTFRR